MLLLGACSTKNAGRDHAPPPLNKDLLRGKWKSATPDVFRTSYEFGDDGTVKMKVQGIKEPIKGRYGWSGERTVAVEFADEETRKACGAAAKSYKDDIKTKIEQKKMLDRIGNTMIAAVGEDTLPEKETYRVGISDPKYLILTREDSIEMRFQRED
jgi:hypothetical protein